MTTERDVLGIVEHLYDCAVAPERWPDALQHIGRTLDCCGVALTLISTQRRRQEAFAIWGFPPEFQKAILDSNSFNPFLSHFWFVPVDVPFTSIDVIGRDAYYSSRFYREVIAPFGYCDSANTNLVKSNDVASGLSLGHDQRQGEWTRAQVETVALLSPHVRRAVMISDLLEEKALKAQMLAQASDLLNTGIVLLDAQSRVAYVNRAAEQLMATTGALRRVGDTIAALRPADRAHLAAAITAARSDPSLPGRRGGAAVPICGHEGRDVAAWVLPLDQGLRREIGAPFAATVALFLKDLNPTEPAAGELFVQRYGITAAECRVLMFLVQGLSPAETADGLGVSLATVKTHMTRLFEKTGMRGQAELMRLAMTVLAPAQS